MLFFFFFWGGEGNFNLGDIGKTKLFFHINSLLIWGPLLLSIPGPHLAR